MNALLRLLWEHPADSQGLICAFTPDGEKLIGGAEDGSLYAFARDGSLLWRQQIQGEAFRFALSQRSNILAVGTIRGVDTSVLDFESGELLWKYSGGAQTKAGVAVTEDGERIVSGDDDGKIRCFARDGSLLWQYACNHRKIARLSMTPNGRRIVFGGNDHIYCLNEAGELLWKYRTGGEVWAGARVLPDGSRVIGGSNDQYVYLLNEAGELIWRYKLGGNVNITYPTADGAFIAAGSTDSHVYLLSGTGELLWKYRTGDSIYGLSLSADAEFVAVASYDRHIYLFSRTGELLEKYRTGNQVYVVDITADGRFIGSFGFDKHIYLFENRYAARTGAERAEVHGILKQRVIAQVRRAFVENTYYGLCYWFDQFNQLLRRNEFDLCDALIAEARQEGYPFTPAEQRFVDSREGAILLKRGIAAQRAGDFAAAERFYQRAIALQRKAGCPVCENQAQLALRWLAEERLSGLRDPLLDKTYDEVLVLGGSEALLTARLSSAPPDHLPLIIRAATKMRLTKPLLQALRSDDRRLQMLAIATLNRFSDIGEVAPIVAALQHENPFVRWQAAAMLSRQKNLPPDLAAQLLDLIAAERDPDARRILIEIAAHLKVEELTPLLIPLLQDSDNDLRWSAVTALGKVGDRRALPALRKTSEGYTITELSIHDAIQRAIREIEQRFPLPKLTSWSAMRLNDPSHKPATLYWKGESVLFVGKLSGAQDSTLLSFVIVNPQGTELYRLSLSYAEFVAHTERLHAQLSEQLQTFSAPPMQAAPPPLSAEPDYTDDEDEAEDDDEIIDGDADLEAYMDDTIPFDALARPAPDVPRSLNLEVQPGALWVLLSPDITNAWQVGTFSATLYVRDEVTNLDEPMGSLEIAFFEEACLESGRLSLNPNPFNTDLEWAVEYVEAIYLLVRLSALPLHTELRAEVWYGEPERGQLVLSETRLSAAESDANLQFQFQQPHWRVGTYTARFLIRGVPKLTCSFKIKPYTYETWQSLPEDVPYLWEFFGRHLIRTGRGAALVQVVKDMRYLVAKTALCRPHRVEADLNLAAAHAPADAQLAILRREYARIHHILAAAQKSDEIAATLVLWLGDVPALQPLVADYARSLALPRLAAWHDLPALHPALIRTLRGHLDSVLDCAYSPDGSLLATVSEDQSVRLWDVQTGNLRTLLRGLNHRQYSCDISRDGKWLVSSGWQQLQLWDVQRGARVRVLNGHGNTVIDSAFHPDSQRLLSVGNDGFLRLWDVSTGAELHNARSSSEHPPNAVAFNSDGRLFCSAHRGGDLMLWQTELFDTIRTLSISSSALRTVAFSPDDAFIAAGNDAHEVLILSLEESTRPLRKLIGHEGIVQRVAFSPNGEWLASVGSDTSLRLWRWRSEQTPRVTAHGHLQAVRAVAFHPDGTQLATTSEDKDVKVWDVQRLLQDEAVHPRAMPMWYADLSQDGNLALSDDRNRLILWDVATGAPIRTMASPQSGGLFSCAISPDNRWALSGGQDHRLRLWDLASGRLLRTLEGHSQPIWRVAISPNGEWFASASADQSVRVWEFSSGETRLILNGHSEQVNCCAISPNGRYIASASADGTARLWWAEDGSERNVFSGHGGNSVLVCAFSPDGRYLATGGYDKKIKLYSVRTGDDLMTLEGHTHNVQALAFSPDGEWLLSGARNGGLRLWRLRDHTCLHSLFIDRGVTNCAFLPDGERVMIASGSGLYLLRIQFA